MDVYKGTGAFSGIAIGKILYYHKSEYQMRQYEITDVKTELNIFRQARTRVMEQLEDLYEKNCIIQGTQAEIFLRQKNLLEGKSFQRAIESVIQSEKVNSAYAVMTTRDEMLKTFRTLEEPAIKERLDNMREISDRLIGELGGISPRIDLGDEPVIVVTESITPTELMEMDKDKLMAIVTHHGSDMSHAAIMAKTMNIPALLEIDTDSEWDGRQAIVDGYTGTLYIDPDEEVKKEYEIRRQADKEEREELLKLRREPDITKDGREIEIYANIGNMDDLNSVLYYGAAGIGLLRSEFQYLGRENYPRENELFLAYKKIAETMGEKLTVIDRQNPLLRKKYNDHHPAVLRMIQMVIEAGHAENRRVCICGELAADTALTEEFLRMGVDCLSVVPACILPVRKALRQVDLSGDDKGA